MFVSRSARMRSPTNKIASVRQTATVPCAFSIGFFAVAVKVRLGVLGVLALNDADGD